MGKYSSLKKKKKLVSFFFSFLSFFFTLVFPLSCFFFFLCFFFTQWWQRWLSLWVLWGNLLWCFFLSFSNSSSSLFLSHFIFINKNLLWCWRFWWCEWILDGFDFLWFVRWWVCGLSMVVEVRLAGNHTIKFLRSERLKMKRERVSMLSFWSAQCYCFDSHRMRALPFCQNFELSTETCTQDLEPNRNWIELKKN